MSYTQSQLDALREAYASGVTEVSYDGKTVKYRSLAEIATAINTVANALGQGPSTRQHYPGFRRFGG